MTKGTSGVIILVACFLLHPALAEDFSVIDPNRTPGKARFMQLAQAKFDKDHKALFKTTIVAPEDEQPLFECMMKAVLADIPDADAARAADMVEHKIPRDSSVSKWFVLDPDRDPQRLRQVFQRAKVICPQYHRFME